MPGNDGSKRRGGRRPDPARTLAGCDGSDPEKPILIAYEGRIYDVTDSFMWRDGRHFWHRAGRTFTASDLVEAPHGAEMLRRVRPLGRRRRGK
jgi:predicted heme/steroid binding protein